ncbi:restriction endonuclease subunit S [Lacrimispora sp.]|uniref:restriction endonuclease subunit S n=1 Tax=Lacrimispora sp. TaxID=2719234 RepID=UPI00285DD79D|nr:restriction endonuclease subunit S [Lacrimispora sp.]MDR7812377.1 restriction endonuclease subunit S [Lacrimispora sp.]
MSREMKDSGLGWVGSIPSDWDIRKVKELYSMQTGFTPDTSNDSYYTDADDGYEWITIGDLTNDRTIPSSTKKHISSKYINERHPDIIPKDSLLYSFKLSVGQVAFTDRNIYSNEAIASFLQNELVDLSFLYYSSFLIEFNANENIYGAKILNQQLIKNAYIVFPPLTEQKKIVNYLDDKCSKIAEIISRHQSIIEKLEEYKKAIITQIVTKGLNHDVEMKDSGITYIGIYPASWKIIRIKYLLDERNERSIFGLEEPLSMSQIHGLIPTAHMERVPLIAATNVGAKIAFKNDLVFNKLKAHLGVFSVSNYHGLVSPDYAVYVAKDDCVPKYLEYLFKTNSYIGEFKKRSTGVGAGLTRLYTSGLFEIKCAMPSFSEQQRIVKYLDNACAKISEAISRQKATIEKLEEYKKSLIYNAVTGKIDCR